MLEVFWGIFGILSKSKAGIYIYDKIISVQLEGVGAVKQGNRNCNMKLYYVKYIIGLLLFTVLLVSEDFYRVFGVDSTDTLAVRVGPNAHRKKIYSLQYNAKNISVNFCEHTSSYSTWCKISYFDKTKMQYIQGWVNKRYLFPISSDPILYTKDTINKAGKLIFDVIKYIVKNRPCKLNVFINKDFGFYSFIIAAGDFVHVYHMRNICLLDSKEYTDGVYKVVEPVMGHNQNRSMPYRAVYGKIPIYDYGIGKWRMKNGDMPKKGYIYFNTLENDDSTEEIFFDPNITSRYLPGSDTTIEERKLLERLKFMQRYSYRVVWPENNLAFYITLINGRFFLTAFDFASMNAI